MGIPTLIDEAKVKTVIRPSRGLVVCDCGKCQGRTFQPHVEVHPTMPGVATVKELVCVNCGFVLQLQAGMLAGKVDVAVKGGGIVIPQTPGAFNGRD